MKKQLTVSIVMIAVLALGCIYGDDNNDEEKIETYTASGSVVDSDNTGIEGTVITLTGVTEKNNGIEPLSVLTDHEGNFSFENLVNGSYTVIPEREGYIFSPIQRAFVIQGASVTLDSFIGSVFVPDEFAEYTITFTATWSAETHPLDFPPTPHFSPITGAYHNEEAVFWEEGGLATPGIKEVAETGRRDLFTEEVLAAVDSGGAYLLLWGGGISISPGSVTIAFTAHRDYHYATLVSMLAPSPDWFVGVSGMNLFEFGNWLDERTVDLYVHDAGTDSGETFTAANLPTPVPEMIGKLEGYAFGAEDTLKPVGTFTFTRTGGE